MQAHATDDDCQKPSRRTHVHVEIQEAEVSKETVHIFGPIEVHLAKCARYVLSLRVKVEARESGDAALNNPNRGSCAPRLERRRFEQS